MDLMREVDRLPFPVPGVLEVAPGYRRLQAEQPVAPVETMAGDPAWLVTGYAEVKALCADERLGRSHPAPDRAPRLSGGLLGGPIGNYEAEPEHHSRLRGQLGPSFSARRMKLLRSRIQELAGRQTGRLAALPQPVDLHAELSFPLAVQVICELLGVPYEDHPKFRVWSAALINIDDGERSAAALGDFTAYMEGLVASKRRTPADDVVSDLAALAAPPARIAMLAATLLFTGHETTAARIDFGTLLLALHPAQWEMLHDDPALVPGAVEEILRFAPTVGGLVLRYARTGIDIGGVRIRAGDAVLLAFAAANRAPEAFPGPDRFDITRQPNPHLGFGYGQHYCIGGSLARIELRVVLESLVRCLLTPRLAVPLDELPVREDVFARSLVALPVTLVRRDGGYPSSGLTGWGAVGNTVAK